MSYLEQLKQEVGQPLDGAVNLTPILMAQGYRDHFDEPVPISRAYAFEALVTRHVKHVYLHDRIIGSIRGKLGVPGQGSDVTQAALDQAVRLVQSYGSNTFWTNTDHFAPDYATLLADGIGGTRERIRRSRSAFAAKDAGSCAGDDNAKTALSGKNTDKHRVFLQAADLCMQAFSVMVQQYGEAASAMAASLDDDFQEIKNNLMESARICRKLATSKPDTFHEALQLVWLAHIAFLYEGRYAMAFGRLDQYLYPFYQADREAGHLSRETAIELVGCMLYKIGESRLFGQDDVVNIAIAGRRPDGSGGLNELSYVVLEAVRQCNIPGPNLSARIYEGIDDAFLDACLQVIGTGLGYPALMNDEINIPALSRHGYAIEDCRDYCMVGCIENFIAGKQPPWSDGRYNSPKYLELALNNGRCLLTGAAMGPETGDPDRFLTMSDLMSALERQMAHGAAEYMAIFNNENDRYNRVHYTQPFLSCFCQSCIERGLDINDGGALYPSVHGAGCMGIATMSDSLAAIEQLVYQEKTVSLTTLLDALAADFIGYEDLRTRLLRAPKYGNNDDFVDKYAVWFVDCHDRIFARYRTHDGGAIYTAIASNVSNIPAGREVAATPDGRKSRQPLSDAASPAQGADRNGPTSAVQSIAKPDYTKVSCGTVLNQKYSPIMFTDPKKRARLLALIKVYFAQGGQEIQINSVSRRMLQDAIDHPEAYKNLVVRVSGFSAYYTQLDPNIQHDILERTEHE